MSNATSYDGLRVRPTDASRKARFRAALALAHMTETSWALERKCSRQHLYLVLKGERESAKLVAEIDAFIAKYLTEAA